MKFNLAALESEQDCGYVGLAEWSPRQVVNAILGEPQIHQTSPPDSRVKIALNVIQRKVLLGTFKLYLVSHFTHMIWK